MVKKLLSVIIVLLIGGQIFAQSVNKCWSIDYETWNTTGQPALFINCGNNDAFNLGGELTLEAWVRAYTFGENRKFMGKIFYNDPINNGYVLGFENLHVYAEYFNPTKQEVPRQGDGPMPPDSSFVHIVTTYSISNTKIKNYVNGMLAGETVMFPNTAIVANNQPFIIGNAPWDTVSFQFYGDMDEVRVWNVALSQEQIQNTMFTQLHGTEEGLVAYYNFNDADGEIIPDNGPNGFDGRLSNFDHQSTSFAPSAAPVGDGIMSNMQDVDAIWYRNSENYHKLITNTGIIVIGDIQEKEFRKYLVAGNNGNDGVDNNFAPLTNPAGFIRTRREWYFNTDGNIGGGITFTLNETGVTTGEMPSNADLENYALLYRISETDNFRAIAHPTIPFDGIFQFNNQLFKDGFYALGYSTEEFELQGSDGIENNVFRNLIISPNPATDFLLIKGVPLQTTISLFNSNGLLISKDIILNENTSLDISNLANGMYFIEIQNDNNRVVKKIVKN